MAVSADNRLIAKALTPAIGLNPKIIKYWDKDEKFSVDIMKLDDPIDNNVNFYFTIGLSDQPLIINDEQVDFRLELALTGYSNHKFLPNILSTIGFYILKDKWECKPGAVFMRMIEMYEKNSPMKHVYFSQPYLWEDKLTSMQLPGKQVKWLLSIPISDNELNYKNIHGSDALEEIFQSEEIDIFDLKRKSVL